MSYLDKYPDCAGCPVSKYCGTMVSSIRLCHSCDDKNDAHVLTLSKAASADNEEEYARERLEMWDNITD
jgi:hypothetical protein